MTSDTIYALSSAPGKAGVAVVRVSGPGAHASLKILAQIEGKIIPRRALFKPLHDNGGNLIDQALILPFKAPASFTGEDVVEYHLHGSPAVLEALQQSLSTFDGHRPATHGEFTRRAFENGKMDLTEAEAIADLINAETQMQREQALSQMGGALFNLYEDWRARLIKAMAYIEAVIDFPDEDVPDSESVKTHPALEQLRDEISAHLNDNRRGERLRDGIRIAILGAPNAGKSSLLNVLAKRDVAIVSPTAGTTRDVIEVHLDLAGYPVIIADTAGLRTKTDGGDHAAIESEGIKRALARADDADLRILVFDGTQKEPDVQTSDLLNDNSVVIFTKSDICHPEGASRLKGLMGSLAIAQDNIVNISSITGQNIDKLLGTLTQKIQSLYAVSRDTPSLTRERHRAALQECVKKLKEALSESRPELKAEQLRIAATALGRITGRVDVEDLLDVIFKDFCIGK